MSATMVSSSPGLSGWRKEILRTVVAVVIAGLIIGLTASHAVRRGMNHTLAISYGEEIAVSIALSDMVYGVHLGYVGLSSVVDTIQKYWNGGADGWSKLDVLVSNFHSGQVLDDGIRAAASLGPQKLGYFTDGSFVTTIYDDMGEVDFYKLSFALFGMKIESLFKMFFLLLGISAITFILTFRNNVYALAALFCSLFSFFIEFYLAIYDQISTPTIFGMRHDSTLGLVPLWHLALLLVFPRKASPWLVAGALLQVAIMILAWRVRGSVAWMFIFLVLLSLVLAAARSWPAQAQRVGTWLAWARSWPLLLRDTLRWPVVLLLFGLLVNGVYNQQSRHLIYSTDDVLPQHGLWWTGVNALHAVAPDLFSPRAKDTGGVPEGWWYMRDYLDRIHLIPWTGNYDPAEPAPGLYSAWAPGAKHTLENNVMKGVFLEALTKRPLESLRVYLIDQPAQLLLQLKLAFLRAPTSRWIWLTLAAGAGIFGFLCLFGGESDPSSLGKTMSLAAAAMIGSGLPLLWAHASFPTMPDTILLTVCFMSLALGFGAYWVFRHKWPR